MESSGAAFGNVTDRLVRAAVARARSRRQLLSRDGQTALGELASRAALELQEQGLLDDEVAVARTEQSIVRVVDALPRPLERRGARQEPPAEVGEAAVMQAFGGLCPGLWPLC